MKLRAKTLNPQLLDGDAQIEVPDPPYLIGPEAMHPHFSVHIDVSRHYVTKPMSTNVLGRIVEAVRAKASGDEIIQLATGSAVRRLEPMPDGVPYEVDFCCGNIDDLIHERRLAKALEPLYQQQNALHPESSDPDHIQFQPLHDWGFGRIVADHIERAAMVNHADVSDFTGLSVKAPEGFDELLKTRYGEKRTLEAYLQFYFNVEG